MFFDLIIMESISVVSLLWKSIKDLIALRAKFKKELYLMRVKLSLRSLEKTHHIRILRKNIARVNTVISWVSQ